MEKKDGSRERQMKGTYKYEQGYAVRGHTHKKIPVDVI